NLVVRELVEAECAQLLYFCGVPWSKHDEGLDVFAELGMLYRNHRGLLDRGMTKEGFLDFERADIVPTPYDHVLLAIEVIEEAVRIEISDVAGQQPAVSERCLGKRRLIEIFPHHA